MQFLIIVSLPLPEHNPCTHSRTRPNLQPTKPLPSLPRLNRNHRMPFRTRLYHPGQSRMHNLRNALQISPQHQVRFLFT